MNKSIFSDQKLLRQLAADSTVAFKLLFDQNYPSIIRVLMRYSNDQNEIKHWVQEIYIQLWKYRASFKSESVENFKAYSVIVARNYAIRVSGKSKKIAAGEHIQNVNFDVFNLVQEIGYIKSIQKTKGAVFFGPLSRPLIGHAVRRVTSEITTSVKIIETQLSRTFSILRQELVVFRR